MPHKRTRDQQSHHLILKLNVVAFLSTIILTALFVQPDHSNVTGNFVGVLNPTATVESQQPTMSPPVEPTQADYERLFARATAEAPVNLAGYVNAPSDVLLRGEPCVEANIVGQLSHLDAVRVFGQSADKVWIKIQDQNSGNIGWVFVQFIVVADTIESLPILGYAGQIKAPGGLIVRSEPFIMADSVGQLRNNEFVTVFAQSYDSRLVKIQSHADDSTIGWVFAQFINVEGDKENLPILGYPAQINVAGGIYLRAEPRVDVGTTDKLNDAELVTVFGQSHDNLWVRVQSLNNPRLNGWTFATFIEMNDGIDHLPIIEQEFP